MLISKYIWNNELEIVMEAVVENSLVSWLSDAFTKAWGWISLLENCTYSTFKISLSGSAGKDQKAIKILDFEKECGCYFCHNSGFWSGTEVRIVFFFLTGYYLCKCDACGSTQLDNGDLHWCHDWTKGWGVSVKNFKFSPFLPSVMHFAFTSCHFH